MLLPCDGIVFGLSQDTYMPLAGVLHHLDHIAFSKGHLFGFGGDPARLADDHGLGLGDYIGGRVHQRLSGDGIVG